MHSLKHDQDHKDVNGPNGKFIEPRSWEITLQWTRRSQHKQYFISRQSNRQIS